MIYTVTLNPSIDYIVRLDKLTSGITNRTTSEEYYYGGKGINVSLVLAELDLDSTAYGFVAGFTGKAIENGIRNDHIITDFIKLKEGISRINIKIKAGEETEINCQGPHIDEQELERLLQKIDRIQPGDTLILAGSIPNTMPDDTYEIMMQRIGDKDVRIVVDATKQLLVNSLKYHPFLIKPNRQELSEIFNVEVKTEEDIEHYAKELQKLGARNVLISLGGEGAMLIDENGGKHKAGVLKEKVINTVGSGDSMVAGFVAGYELKHDYAYALKLGSVCGNATAFLSGLATKEKINELLEKFEKEFVPNSTIYYKASSQGGKLCALKTCSKNRGSRLARLPGANRMRLTSSLNCTRDAAICQTRRRTKRVFSPERIWAPPLSVWR